MINISSRYKVQIQSAFLWIFISFLSLSISHSHNFDLTKSVNDEFKSFNSENEDIFIESNYHCIIHSFYNSLNFEFIVKSHDPIDFQLRDFENLYTFHYQSDFSFSIYLRAPPSNLV